MLIHALAVITDVASACQVLTYHISELDWIWHRRLLARSTIVCGFAKSSVTFTRGTALSDVTWEPERSPIVRSVTGQNPDNKSNWPFLPSNSLKEYHSYTICNLGIRFHQCLSPQKENNQTYWLHLEELEFPVADISRILNISVGKRAHMTATWQSHETSDSHMSHMYTW